jgi:hypothetical protein
MQTIILNRKPLNVTAPQQRVLETIARNGGAVMVSELAEGTGRRTHYPCALPFAGMTVTPASWIKSHPGDYPVTARRLVKDCPRARDVAYLAPHTGRAILSKLATT